MNERTYELKVSERLAEPLQRAVAAGDALCKAIETMPRKQKRSLDPILGSLGALLRAHRDAVDVVVERSKV